MWSGPACWRYVSRSFKEIDLTIKYASICGKARNAVRSKAGAALKAEQIDRAVHETVLAQELILKRGNEVRRQAQGNSLHSRSQKLWMSIGGFVHDGYNDVERLKLIAAH